MKEYCHFTSPIRRYADLVNHRIIKKIILKRYKYDVEMDILKEDLGDMYEHISHKEYSAMKCER